MATFHVYGEDAVITNMREDDIDASSLLSACKTAITKIETKDPNAEVRVTQIEINIIGTQYKQRIVLPEIRNPFSYNHEDSNHAIANRRNT